MKSLLALIVLAGSTAFAADITLTNAKIFAPIQGSNTTAGYGVIKNTSKKAVTIKAVEAKPFTAIELHETKEKDGRMSMQKMEQITLEPGKEFELKQGGNHIMLFDATSKVEANQKIKVKLLVNNKEENFEIPVVPRNENKEEHHHH